jgi:tRNA pseudouridine38-40 synthase
MTQRYFIHLAYDGTHYHGWQIQPNGSSVQETLMKSLRTFLRQEIEIVGAGRTDAGVHASCMMAHFDYEGVLDTQQAVHKVNRILPQDIVVYSIKPVESQAHARFDATYRTYYYHVVLEKSPFRRQYACRLQGDYDFERMNEAAQHLFDYIDFTSFSKLHTDVKTNNCRIMKAEWVQQSPTEWMFVVQADRFLRNMVRAIVGTLLEVGRGKISVADFCRIIENKDRCSAGASVPGHALFLADIGYPQEIYKP